ncbi:flippase [Limosilactobacillus fermentum]
MKSENKNFIMNVVYQLLIYIFPLITTPYISRVLGVNNIGIYSYTYSIVNLFMLAAMLGMNNYGNREIARIRDDQTQMNRKFSSMYGLQLVTSTVTLAVYIFYVIFICRRYREIAAIQFIFLISTCFDVNWFYFGLEKFKLTISRNVLIKVISLVFIFLCVRNRNDLWVYTAIMGSATLISQLYLIFILHRYVHIVRVKWSEIFSHFKQVLVLLIPVLAYGIYAIMDKIMIGGLSSTVELGNFENAQKIISIPISVITALGTVMLPRMSYVLNNKKSEYKPILRASMKLAMVMATTMTFGIWAVADEISLIMFGPEFTRSAGIMRFLAIYLPFTACANVVRTQFLIPTRRDRVYVESTIFGAVINLIFNIIFIPGYGAYGACIGTVLAEVSVMLWQTIKSRKELEIGVYVRLFLNSLWKSAVMFAACMIISRLFHETVISFAVKMVVAIAVFAVLNRKFIWNDFLGKGQSTEKQKA